jgi:hypothetical protein
MRDLAVQWIYNDQQTPYFVFSGSFLGNGSHEDISAKLRTKFSKVTTLNSSDIYLLGGDTLDVLAVRRNGDAAIIKFFHGNQQINDLEVDFEKLAQCILEETLRINAALSMVPECNCSLKIDSWGLQTSKVMA